MNLRRIPTTVRKEKRCAIEGSRSRLKVILIAPRRRNVKVVRRKSAAHQVAYRALSIHWDETARQAVCALVGTPAYERSRRARYKIEALFAELKQLMGLRRVRLRRLWSVSKQFLLAATAQNLKRLVRFLTQRNPTPGASGA
jgi:hypothetical protein